MDAIQGSNPVADSVILGSKYITPDYLFERLTDVARFIFTQKSLQGLYTVLSIFSIFFLAVIVYSAIRIFEIRKKEAMYREHKIAEYARRQALREAKRREEETQKNPRWKKALEYLASKDENDWRLAVLEADSMLYDLLSQMGFQGESLGKKLKSADRDSFHSLSAAWEAHNLRNRIAHDGLAYKLTEHEAKRAVALYQQVFEEFGFI